MLDQPNSLPPLVAATITKELIDFATTSAPIRTLRDCDGGSDRDRAETVTEAGSVPGIRSSWASKHGYSWSAHT
jgi:hypothetical protein